MFDDSAHTLAWARRILAEHVTPAIHSQRRPLDVAAWTTPDSASRPPSLADALSAQYTPADPGTAWGAPWSTWWFTLSGEVPAEFSGRRVEAVIDLGFTSSQPGFQAEGLLYDWEGLPLKGIHPRNRWFKVTGAATAGQPVRLRLEAAANPTVLDDFTATPLGDLGTAGSRPLYRLGRVDLALFEEDVFGLAMDLDVLLDLAEQLDPESGSGFASARSREILAAMSDALADLDVHDVPGTAAAARAGLVDVLASPATASAHRLTGVAHAHIDSAWLWPVRETRRKCARTFANVTALAHEYPELVFACSSAQQYRWIKDDQPEIFARILDAARNGNWEPVGGMWVEADGVLPSGESLARQLLYGQRFFASEFGRPCPGVWLPDSFGYSASYPQIAKLAGAEWFLTQKISWNDTNTFPHHTFWWEGIDGTRILTHFPPADTYNADLSGADVHRSARQFRERGRSRKALVPFGFGNGGGGPEREMVERARRLASLEGSPAVRLGTAREFFADVRQEYAAQAPAWRGELYLELHRGTLTSQRAMKRGNRHCESLLRQAELVWTMVSLRGLADWPGEVLAGLWERVLLMQFHDILPGSSIAWVHAEARADYERILARLTDLVAEGLRLLGGGLLNAGPLPRREVVAVPVGPAGTGELRLVETPALSVGSGQPLDPVSPVAASGRTLTNGLVSVTIADDGSIASLVDHRHDDRQVLPESLRGAQLRLHPDLPLRWDAWDLDKRHAATWVSPEIAEIRVVESGPLRSTIEARTHLGRSAIVQRTTLRADSPRIDIEIEVDWADRDAALAAYLPVSVLSREAAAEIQFGHLTRPTHENTSWESAKFEAVAHRWLHVGETGWGIAVVNDSTYGHSARSGVAPGGEPITTLRLTLLRAPGFPDPTTDAGRHVVKFGIVPGADVADAIAHGYAVNLPLVSEPGVGVSRGCEVDPLVTGSGVAAPTSLIAVDDPGCLVEAVKLAEDGSGDVIVRLYEALGGRRRARLRPAFTFATVTETDLLELPDSPALEGRRALRQTGAHELGSDALGSDALGSGALGSDEPDSHEPGPDELGLDLRPFQIVTLRFHGCALPGPATNASRHGPD